MSRLSEVDQIVYDILADMPLKEKVAIANLGESDVPYLQYAFDICVRDQLGKDAQKGKDVMHRMWEVLHETHRARIVK